MNRIYQGKVTKVEILDGQDPQGEMRWRELPAAEWQAALWRHHELFQDAVNYYTLCLAAMAAGAKGDSPQAKALGSWVARVEETWTTASRRAQVFDGPGERLAKLLKLKAGEAGFDKAAAHVLRTSRATAAQRSAALLQLLDEADKGDLNQVCVRRIAFLCPARPDSKTRPTSEALASSQMVKRQEEVRRYHRMTRPEALKAASDLKLDLFLTQPPTQFLKGQDAAKELSKKFAQAAARHPELKKASAKYQKHLTVCGDKLKMPAPGRKPSGLYPLAAVFKYFPCRESLDAFLQATRTLAEGKDKTAAEDAIADARVGDHPHFDYFTNLALVPGVDGDRETRAVWFEYDLAAFIEALKAPHRYYQDTLKREAAAEGLRRRIASMDGRGCEASGDDEASEPLPGFEGDERIRLLQIIVRDRLKWVAEAEGWDVDSEEREYTIRERTLRGFGEIKRRWRAAAEDGSATENHLLKILAAEQTEHRDDFGSSELYRELAKPMFHPIWRDEGTQPWHAEDPLRAWLAYNDLKAELVDKERPIRFTPAHPEYSPRFFIFPKRSESKPKKGERIARKPGLLSRHEPGQLAFTAGIVLPTDRGLAPKVARIQYAAPRLCRDRIRTSGDSDLHEAPWVQPMMAALGLAESPERVNFANCRITLEPANPCDIQLVFPLEVGAERIKKAVAPAFSWERQFNKQPEGVGFCNASLRWPHEKQPSKAPTPWHKEVDEFRSIAVDLGQRNAGAYARICVRSGRNPGKRPSRAIGETDGKRWRAELERAGQFRLPGEDARIWRERSKLDARRPDDSGLGFDFREELWGDRGRPARDWEADDTAELMRLLEAPPEDERHSILNDGWRRELSFPEQNDKLLIAMRRFQSRIARLHRWCWMLGGNDRQKDIAWTEITECEDARLAPADLRMAAEKRDPRVKEGLERQLRERIELAPDILMRIANRVLPLRGRSWRWERHPSSTPGNTLHHLIQSGPPLDSGKRPVWLRGQRGLSLRRIEQIEELRKRFQSLNQSLRREVGGKAPIRRDEAVPDTCPDLLEKLSNLKEQRINQTAHLILAEALGLRLAPPAPDKKALRQRQDQHGAYEKILDGQGRWIGVADFIVVENLSRYRASQGRAPRENSRLMKWCHRAVRDKLTQLCEVFGLPVVETPAAYSSRFCSRSGVPGFRAAEVAAGFTKHGQWRWIAAKKDERGRPTGEAQRLVALDRQLAEAQVALEKALVGERHPGPFPKRTLLVPSAGGGIFVPIVDAVKGAEMQPALAQADVNAAINLALRAVADPRVWGIYPRLRTICAGTGQTDKGKRAANRTPCTDGMRLLAREKRRYGEKGPAITVHRLGSAGKNDTAQPNFFADLAGLASVAQKLGSESREHRWLCDEWTTAEIRGEEGAPALVHGKSFWGCVKAAQWSRIQEINGRRLTKWRSK